MMEIKARMALIVIVVLIVLTSNGFLLSATEFNNDIGGISLSSAENVSYKITAIEYSNGKIKIRYPQIEGLTDIKKQEKINMLLKEKAFVEMRYLDPANDYLEIDFRIAWMSHRLLSIKFCGASFAKGAAYPRDLFYTLNIDMNNGIELMISDIVVIDQNFVKKFKRYDENRLEQNLMEEQFQMDGKERIPKEIFEDLVVNDPDELCIEIFNDFYLLYGVNFFFFTEDALGISYHIPHVAGDHLEVLIDCTDIKENLKFENEVWKDFSDILHMEE